MSNELTRRSFFRGVVATVATTSLVVEASSQEIAQFSKGKEIVGYEILPPENKGDPVLYARHPDGRFVPWAYVDDMTVERDFHEVTAFKDEYRHYIPSPRWIWQGHFRGIGSLTIERYRDVSLCNGYPFSVKFPPTNGRW